MSVNEKVARLRKFALSKFGSVRQMSLAIGRSPDYFSTYFAKDLVPGRRILSELVSHGLDLDWLDTGEDPQDSPVTEEPLNREGQTMDDVFLSELWDQFTEVLPGAPSWNALTAEERRRILASIGIEILKLQEGLQKPEVSH